MVVGGDDDTFDDNDAPPRRPSQRDIGDARRTAPINSMASALSFGLSLTSKAVSRRPDVRGGGGMRTSQSLANSDGW